MEEKIEDLIEGYLVEPIVLGEMKDLSCIVYDMKKGEEVKINLIGKIEGDDGWLNYLRLPIARGRLIRATYSKIKEGGKLKKEEMKLELLTRSIGEQKTVEGLVRSVRDYKQI